MKTQTQVTSKSAIEEKVREYIRMQQAGEILPALEKFYADDVVMQENELAPTVGKDANRERETEFLNNITAFRAAEVKSISIGEDTAAIEWHYDYDHKEWGTRNYHQVSLQRWRDGKIVYERFYYGS